MFQIVKTIKNNESVSISIDNSHEKGDENTYFLYATNALCENVGLAIFLMNKKFGYLMNIIVKDKRYLGQNLGSKMLETIEDFLFLNDVKKINGSFIPTIDENFGYSYDSAYNLYSTHGYEFEDDYFYGTSISKQLTKLNDKNATLSTQKELQ